MDILYISYFYPPLGGPATFRNTKAVKYLSSLGANIDVITVREIEYLLEDNSLLSECRERELIRTASLDPMAITKKLSQSGAINSRSLYLGTSERMKRLIRGMIPVDDKIAWVPFVIAAGITACQARSYDLIYVSCGPFSSAIAASYLASRFHLPLVVDYRDYWTLLSDYNQGITKLHRGISSYWERRILRQSALLVTATSGIGRDLCAAFGEGLEDRQMTVYNGWDEEDFQNLPTSSAKNCGFEIAYYGAIYARRSMKNLYAALLSLRQQELLPPDTKLRLYGNYFVETYADIEASGISDLIEVVPQLQHREALAQMMQADVLVLNINSSSPYGTLTSKIFEYIRSQRPILAMVPAAKEAAELLRSCGHDYICAMESASTIEAALSRCLEDLKSPNPRSYQIPPEYERSQQLTQLYHRLSTI
ncbi:MAG: hypothetical protein CVU48_03715 [Candidatus Cloacimonetes bacterium HGW-Cloacimonetes-1]|jgi:glycosyltransferase involved in cell wall biosynthesis|nr:MAG: hypothetical protein CVU48_03715 [Candidatus Cloacimonetes bacterium HGW-Cloacimonetes-1]